MDIFPIAAIPYPTFLFQEIQDRILNGNEISANNIPCVRNTIQIIPLGTYQPNVTNYHSFVLNYEPTSDGLPDIEKSRAQREDLILFKINAIEPS